jgi:hypothetical protein
LADRTPEQIAADEQLETAIRRAALAYWAADDPDKGEILTDWIVVISHENMTNADDQFYGTLGPGGSVTPHRAIGLLDIGKRLLLFPKGDDE